MTRIGARNRTLVQYLVGPKPSWPSSPLNVACAEIIVDTLIGYEAEVEWPGYTEYVDYEFELGFVIGRTAHNLTPEEAGDCFFGLTGKSEVTARGQSHQAISPTDQPRCRFPRRASRGVPSPCRSLRTTEILLEELRIWTF